MKIPKIIEDKFSFDQELSAFVTGSVARVSQYVTSSRLEFFPEYTDHSITHLEAVLASTLEIATDDSVEILNAEDAAVLTVAVALHDLGMHLTREGFQSLVAPTSVWVGIPEIDTQTWSELWNVFLGEASRFDGRRLRSLFGENYQPARVPPRAEEEWEDRDYLLVGEFLRRHHARLAHEIAIYGLPGLAGACLEVCPRSSERMAFLADVSGLVARSHGLPIRSCLPYLETRYQNPVDPRRVRAAYLMVLLRVADYLQLQPERAPTGRTSVGSLRSPVSGNEWKVHQSVKDIRNTSTDPEAIVVSAEPPDAESFLRLAQWLSSLQSEIDTSWAVIGEVFGLQRGLLSKLGLRVRRIKSNTDDVSDFAARVSYVPAKLSFEAANADLLKLLVGPLYENDHSVGLRELLQNAVDAVRERREMSSRTTSGTIEDTIADVEVEVTMDDEGNLVSVLVRDHGVGMTVDTLRNYFLRVGASFRRSDAWRDIFEDQDGHSRVLRSGRFGVGVLAAFLLGSRITVTTRHHLLDSSQGLTFRAAIDDDAINVTRCEAPIGTTVLVESPADDVWPGNFWDGTLINDYDHPLGHYFGSEVSIARTLNASALTVAPRLLLPSPGSTPKREWTEVRDGNVTLFWSHTDGPDFACNGIVVKSSTYAGTTIRHLPWPLQCPRISALDPDGLLNINLQRSDANLNDFRSSVAASLVDDLIAYALLTAPTVAEGNWYYEGYEGFRDPPYGEGRQYWALTNKGMVLRDPEILRRIGSVRAYVGVGGQRGFRGWGQAAVSVMLDDEMALSIEDGGFSQGGNRFKGILYESLHYSFAVGPNRMVPEGVIVPSDLVARAKAGAAGKKLRTEMARLEPVNDRWKIDGIASPVLRQLTELAEAAEGYRPMVFATGPIVRPGSEPDEREGLVADIWFDRLATFVVPFSKRERNKLIRSSRGSLAVAIERRRSLLKEHRTTGPSSDFLKPEGDDLQ